MQITRENRKRDSEEEEEEEENLTKITNKRIAVERTI